jgi:hypothetical protein
MLIWIVTNRFEYHISPPNLSPLNQQQDSHIVLDQKLDLHIDFKLDQELDLNQDLDLWDQNLVQHLEGLSQNAFNVICFSSKP